MNQSKAHSAAESITNVLLGYSVAILSQLLIFPLFNINTTLAENFQIALYFTCISLLRSYLIRRFFTSLQPTKRNTNS